MQEKFFAPQERDASVEKLEQELVLTIALWSENLTLLEEKIPHDDVLFDNMTLSYNIFRNRVLSYINELMTIEEMLRVL